MSEMEGLLWSNEVVFIGCIRDLCQTKKNAATNKPKRPRVSQPRHVLFHPGDMYECVRKGRQFATRAEIDETFKNGTLDESMFFIFRHVDANIQRNEHVPKYEAVYKVDNKYIQTQKSHMTQAYANSKRLDFEQIWTVYPDGSPYWVDRHAYRKEKERASKKRYIVSKV